MGLKDWASSLPVTVLSIVADMRHCSPGGASAIIAPQLVFTRMGLWALFAVKTRGGQWTSVRATNAPKNRVFGEL